MASTSNSETTSTIVEENRIGLCKEFAIIAETDFAVAQCYLANNEWEMEVMCIHMLNIGSLKKVYFGNFRTVGDMYSFPLYCKFINTSSCAVSGVARLIHSLFIESSKFVL